MDKYKKLVPLLFFCLFGIKSLILGITFVDVAGLLVLAGFAGFIEYFSNHKQLESLKNDLNVMKEKIDIQAKGFEVKLMAQDKNIESIRTHVGVKQMGSRLGFGNGQ